MKRVPQISRYPLSGGFTLVELLVSSAIIGVVMMILLSATSASLGLWRGAERRIAVDREGRTGLALMADDLANIVSLTSLPPQFGHWQGGVFMEFPVVRPADYQEANAGNVGDVCYVRYSYDSSEKKIYRNHIDSKDTFDAFASGGAPPADSADDEVLADNVTDVYVGTYDSNGAQNPAPADVKTVNLSIGVVDRQEIENINLGIPVPDGKTSKQYFSVNFAVPASP